MKIRWLGEEIALSARAGGEAGVAQAAQILASASQARAPRDSGELAGSTSVEADGLSASVKYNSGHANFVHEGTARMAGRPFLALAAQDGAVRQAMLRAIAEQIKL